MLVELTSAAASVKAMAELLALIHKTKVSEAVEMKAIELNTLIMSLQSECFGLLSKNHELLSDTNELKQKIVDMENWKEESAKYQLHKPAPGVVVYAPKPQIDNAEPFHWLCTNCYNHSQKSFLQRTTVTGNVTYKCFRCSTEFTSRALFDFK